jgi:hypothetical protein
MADSRLTFQFDVRSGLFLFQLFQALKLFWRAVRRSRGCGSARSRIAQPWREWPRPAEAQAPLCPGIGEADHKLVSCERAAWRVGGRF